MYFVDLIDAKNVLAKNLSLGMKKRLDIACSLVHKPSVLILDEPTADLDPLLRFQIMKLIKKINSHGTTIVFTTQLLHEADELCDKIAVLYNKKIVDQGTSSKIKEKYHSGDLDGVFRKIFSNRTKKDYNENYSLKIKNAVLEKEPKESKIFWYDEEANKGEVTKEELEEVFNPKGKKKGILKKIKDKITKEEAY
jgi:ABC-type multidrug transport system ATPase subunit